MLELNLEQLAAVVGGQLVSGPARRWVGSIATDTRAELSGSLFIALRGERFDGHAFVSQALGNGAAAVLVERVDPAWLLERRPDQGAIRVPDTREAYLRLGSWARLNHPAKAWFAVTGSAGKTSVKEMLAQILGVGANLRVHRALKSFNNEVGVPATICSAPLDAQAVVLELGTNHPGEILRLAGVARPHVAILNNAGPSHLEAFENVTNVAREKGDILAFQGAEDIAVLNADDPYFELWRSRAYGRVISFGIDARAGVRAEDVRLEASASRFTLRIGRGRTEVHLPAPGSHNIRNALAAAAAAHAIGIAPEQVAAGLADFGGTARRFQTEDLDGIMLIDDAYNASPLSFQAALETVRHATGGRGRLLIVAGDMLELGATATAHHEALGGQLAALEPAALFTVGPLAGLAGEQAVRAGLASDRWTACRKPEEAAAALEPLLQQGDVVLIKGSNGVGLERCVSYLRERRTHAAAAD
ncbi:MAG: UDP-N-acetylmuramoyl-tripeptide--D-alanyl-D-alanine ligase [Planctomycetes bacterium]|nr:UDP-N-acetylmuramoyl-tripeptide--D-alanyl-D-alanine ligase [Planctomycetota bacterium]